MDDDIVRQLREGGAPEEEIAKLVGQDGDDEDFEIWPENADAARAFAFAAATQWRVAVGMASLVYLGLEYSAVEICFRMQPPEHTTLAEAWWGVQVMEIEAVRLRNEANADSR